MGDNTFRDEPDILELAGSPPSNGVGLCLSGGGYRAMVFHLGTLRRLNETGWLRQLTDVASVSGGSIIAAHLGRVWNRLEFGPGGVACDFESLVERPILDLAGRTIDLPAILTGLLVPGRISNRVQKRYDALLFRGATLQDLPHPDGPRFSILATNLTNGRLWKFSRDVMGDWSTPATSRPTISLAEAVAASSAFPPFLSPHVLRVQGSQVQLCDGGVYDNLGLEPVVKNCATVFVSDGGGTFNEQPRPKRNWVQGLLRVLSTVDVEVRRLRRRQIVGLLASHQRRGAFWAINTDYTRFAARNPALPAPRDATKALAMIKTRLKRMDTMQAQQVMNWGYAACDAALRTYVDDALPAPPGFPYPEVGVG
ncbi:patatin-like phospholipase family protein [Mycolicibacterium sp. CH28]|uniref:patatin-like phospholipase family protein n=1 Tax=Mycolicibacterium sp. CH28 TaxID=2512237 RepID=UPI00108164CC|nr:patatin-like phospholipase family protein [Mycolicibacterium sp. CH28]TGD88108.1 patatin-like phospholipase family protein [Mycolicibacterium sp. CH28]